MNLLIVNHYADPPAGLATRSFDIAKSIVEAGNTCTILVSNFSHYRFEPLRHVGGFRLWTDETIEGVHFVWLRTPGYRGNDMRRVLNMLVFSVLAVCAGIGVRPRPDVVIGVSVHPLAALSGWVIAKLRRARFFFEITDLWPETLIQFGMLRRESAVAKALAALERFLFDRAERIVMLWRHTDDYVRGQGGDPSKIVWVPHGVDLARYASLPPYDGGTGQPFTVQYLGGFAAANSIDTIVDAAAVLQRRGRRDIVIRLTGSGQEKDAIVSRVAELKLDNVVFPPPVPKARIGDAMVGADAFIYGLQDLPLYRYGISLNKLTDYLAAARPIVFFGRSTYDPVAEARAGVSIPPGDPEAVADAIEQLAALPPAERVEMGCRGRKFLEANHNIPVLARRMLDVMAAGT